LDVVRIVFTDKGNNRIPVGDIHSCNDAGSLIGLSFAR
jgi:hypothetical protein